MGVISKYVSIKKYFSYFIVFIFVRILLFFYYKFNLANINLKIISKSC